MTTFGTTYDDGWVTFTVIPADDASKTIYNQKRDGSSRSMIGTPGEADPISSVALPAR